MRRLLPRSPSTSVISCQQLRGFLATNARRGGELQHQRRRPAAAGDADDANRRSAGAVPDAQGGRLAVGRHLELPGEANPLGVCTSAPSWPHAVASPREGTFHMIMPSRRHGSICLVSTRSNAGCALA